jgi:hypothetical protein
LLIHKDIFLIFQILQEMWKIFRHPAYNPITNPLGHATAQANQSDQGCLDHIVVPFADQRQV